MLALPAMQRHPLILTCKHHNIPTFCLMHLHPLASFFQMLCYENCPACHADASHDFQDLISQLLDKNPATRLTWKAMCEHPFWQTPLSQRPMPPEPMLDAFIKRHGLRPALQPVAAAPQDSQLEARVRAAQVQCAFGLYNTWQCCIALLEAASG